MSEASPVSPCVAVCVLDQASGFCRGCYRTIAEISAWSSLGGDEKRRIVAELPARKAALPSAGGAPR